MKTITQLCPLSFLVILVYISGTVESGDNSLINDDIGGVLYKTEDDLETRNYKKSDEYYNPCTYNNGNDPNIRKNIEEIIKVLVKDSLQPAMATLDEQENDIARDIQVAANGMIIELALHASRITHKILQSMKRTNGTQVAVDTEMHNGLIAYQNQIKKIEELEDGISLLSNKTKELTDTINVNNKQQSESMASLNNKIEILENMTTSDIHDIRDMFATIEKNLKSHLNYSELQTNQKEENVTKATSLCDFKVPASIVPNPNIWKYEQIPEKDDLDTYMINKTGCSYLALGVYKHHQLAAGPLPGQLEWRGAVRTRGGASMLLRWDSVNKYDFWVGADGNTRSQLYDHVHAQYPERATPGVLAEDRYVPLYLKIANGKLTAGAECEPEPWFTADFTREEGELIERSVWSGSYYGAKLLYNCPASFTGQ